MSPAEPQTENRTWPGIAFGGSDMKLDITAVSSTAASSSSVVATDAHISSFRGAI